jgi:DNA-binding transcriptional LysR family regulator
MLEGIDALVALEKFGTVSEAATRLRLTQSAVSKRLQALQAVVGFRLVEPDGRRVRLTARAIELLERARPLVAELRALTRSEASDAPGSFSLALADSIASSWGPRVVSRALAKLEGAAIDLHAHRSVLLIESVRLGRYDIGLCTEPASATDLIFHPLTDEPIVLVHSELRAKPRAGAPLISIEPTSATWRAVHPLLRERYPELLARELVFVESFGAAAQMVKAGFGDGLVPLGIAMEMKLPPKSYRALAGVERRVSLVTRKTVNQLAGFVSLRGQLAKETAQYFERRRAR